MLQHLETKYKYCSTYRDVHNLLELMHLFMMTY